MVPNNRTVWQHCAGDAARDCVDLCLHWGVILHGPGQRGRWPDCEPAMTADGVPPLERISLGCFARDLQIGDLIVLHTDVTTVHAVGEIVGAYAWHAQFGDVDGCSLEHLRRVIWLWTSRDRIGVNLGDGAFEPGGTTQQLRVPHTRRWLGSLEPDPLQDPPQPIALPASADDLAEPANPIVILDDLFDRGLSADAVTTLAQRLPELGGLARWHLRHGAAPSLPQVIALLVVPLLRTLGWAPQQIAVPTDASAVYADPGPLTPRPSEASLTLHLRSRHQACASAVPPPEYPGLARHAERTPLRKILTDGIRYAVFSRAARDPASPLTLTAYLNLARLRHTVPVYRCGGAAEALLALSPDAPRPPQRPD